MAEISRSALFGRLNPLCFRSLESAHAFSRLRENPYVELIHWLHQILQLQASDLLLILDAYGIDKARLQNELDKALDALPRGATAVVDFAPHLEEAAERGYVFGSLLFGEHAVRSGHLLYGVLKTRELRGPLLAAAPCLTAIKVEDLSERFAGVVASSPEEGSVAKSAPAAASGEEGAAKPAPRKGEEALAQFTTDLTASAAEGKIDNIIGRDDEIRQVVDILMRRRQNNPILTGEAGVGKTAVVEGFARRIAHGDVPPALKGVRLLSLDVGALSAGASMKGEFEKRLKQVIEEVQSSPSRIILFIDEAHTLIGAGGQAGTGDAANLLKPALARGELRTIAATTWAEYKKHIEKDPALTRRFQTVKVDEPDDTRAIAMMRAIAGAMEKHHKVRILDEALAAAVTLSRRYIPDRQLPDKAVSLIDTACARVGLSQHATPARVEDARRKIESLDREIAAIDREAREGFAADDRRDGVLSARTETEKALEELNARWAKEKEATEKVLSLRRKLSGDEDPEAAAETEALDETSDADAAATPKAPAEDRDALVAQLRAAIEELAAAQGEDPLVLPAVDETAIAQVVGDWTGVPVGRMVRDEMASILALADTLKSRVVGQDVALDEIAKRVRTSRAGLADPQKPIGVFLLCGPSGVGKTETALSLAEALYGGEQNLITLNMSEFQESHTVSTLKGAPPGYVGYGEGGRLTEAVRRRPYSVILLDEVEKAHSDVHEVFFQVFDKGAMEDGEGRLVDFKNTLILLTSNVGDRALSDLADSTGGEPDVDKAREAIRQPLLDVFPPALLGRMIVLPYYPLTDAVLGTLIRMRFERVGRRLADAYGAAFAFDDAVVELVASRCKERESGGRVIDAILTNTVLPTLSERLLMRAMDGEPVSKAEIRVENGDFAYDIV